MSSHDTAVDDVRDERPEIYAHEDEEEAEDDYEAPSFVERNYGN